MKITDEEFAQLRGDYLSGLRLVDLERKYNFPSASIIRLLKADGVFKPTLKRWTKGELEFLKENYPDKEWNYILSNLPRWKKEDIVHKAYKMGVGREDYTWTKEDVELLKRCYKYKFPVRLISVMFDFKYSEAAIYTKANNLGISQREKWTKDEFDILAKNYESTFLEDMQYLLPGRSIETIRTYANGMGLKSKWSNDRAVSINSYRNLSHYLRCHNHRWKLDSMKNCNYECVVTRDRFDEIHHLVGFNSILLETINTYSIKLKEEFSEYSEVELLDIQSKFEIVQNKYPLGVCLKRTVHREFHKMFGYGDNTPKQFEKYLEQCT